jgi:hypothetical protein
MKDLNDMPMTLVMDMLESTAKKHGLKFDLNLINFADDIWAQAQEAQANVTGGWTAEKFKPVQDDDSQVWMKWVDANSYSMKTLKGK